MIFAIFLVHNPPGWHWQTPVWSFLSRFRFHYCIQFASASVLKRQASSERQPAGLNNKDEWEQSVDFKKVWAPAYQWRHTSFRLKPLIRRWLLGLGRDGDRRSRLVRLLVVDDRWNEAEFRLTDRSASETSNAWWSTFFTTFLTYIGLVSVFASQMALLGFLPIFFSFTSPVTSHLFPGLVQAIGGGERVWALIFF